MKLRGLLGALLLAAVVTTAAAEPPPDRRPPDRPEPAEADRAALQEVVDGAGVATAPGAPGWSSYLKDLGVAFVLFLAQLFEGFNPKLGLTAAAVAATVARVLLVLAGVLLAALLVRWLRHRFRGAAKAVRNVRTLPETDPAEERTLSADEWAARLEGHLAAGDVAAACQALWWWLARSLLRSPVEASWTSRELLSHAGRDDLTRSVRILDRLIYGAAKPGPDEVHRLWGELREVLT